MAEIQPAVEDLVICIDPPTLEEVKKAINAMKSGKAGGADGVIAETAQGGTHGKTTLFDRLI